MKKIHNWNHTHTCTYVILISRVAKIAIRNDVYMNANVFLLHAIVPNDQWRQSRVCVLNINIIMQTEWRECHFIRIVYRYFTDNIVRQSSDDFDGNFWDFAMLSTLFYFNSFVDFCWIQCLFLICNVNKITYLLNIYRISMIKWIL